MSEFTVIRCRSELWESVITLRRYAYATEFVEAREYMAWKYEQNPYIREPILYVALDRNGNVAGMRGAYGTSWDTPAGPVVIPCADDFAIGREHRNSGLMTAIMRFALDDLAGRGFEYVINTSGGRLTVLQSIAMGWKSVGPMEPVSRLVWPIRLRGLVRSYTRGRRLLWRLGHTPSAPQHGHPKFFARLDRKGGKVSGSAGMSVVVETAPRPGAMAELALRLPADGCIRHTRDRAFFAWRFGNPSREYRFLFCERNGTLEGWLVIARSRSFRAQMLPFHIADWEGTSGEVRAELLRCALRWGRFEEMGAWAGTRTADERALLKRADFRPALPDLRARGMPCLLLKRLAGSGDWTLGGTPALDLSRWDVQLIDSMHG